MSLELDQISLTEVLEVYNEISAELKALEDKEKAILESEKEWLIK